MLPTQFRLPLRTLPDFFNNAQVVISHYFVVFYDATITSPTEPAEQKSDSVSLPILQAAILAPKKQFVQAVARNYQKRRVSAAVLQIFQDASFLGTISHKSITSLKIVITCKHSINQFSYTQLQEQLAYVSKKLVATVPSSRV